MSIEKLIADLIEAVRENTAATVKLHEGREEAIAMLSQQPGADAPVKRTRKSKDTPAADAPVSEQTSAAPTPAAEPEQPVADAPTAAASTGGKREGDFSEDGLKALAGPYLGGAATPEERQARAAQVKAMLDHFGSPALTGPKATLGEDERYQAHWFLTRIVNGLPVNFSADNDFDSDPLVGGDEPAASDDDDLLG